MRSLSKIPRLQNALQELDENFDVIGLVNFNWGHSRHKPLSLDDRCLRERPIPQSKSTIIKKRYAIRYLAGQERMCRVSGMAQRITPELLNLRSRDQDMHRVLKVALQPRPILVGMKSLIDYGLRNEVGETYFRAEWFCKYNHGSLEDRKAIRQRAVDRASSNSDGPVVSVLEHEQHLYVRPSPTTKAQINADLVTGSSSSLSRSSLSTLPSEERGVTLRSRFSVMGSDAGYSGTIDGDDSDFGEAYGIYRR